MSTTQASVTVSSTPSPSTTVSSTSSPLNATSTLLFGFLVSALSMFAIFMTSAIIWNRLVARRRAIDAMLAMDPYSHRDPQLFHRPIMWDVRVAPNKQSFPWSVVKPMAARQCDRPTGLPRTTRPRQIESFWRHCLLDWLPPEITYLFHQPIPPILSPSREANTSHVGLSDGSDIQVLLLISMPHPPQSAQGNQHGQGLYEMVFATTKVIYHDPGPS